MLKLEDLETSNLLNDCFICNRTRILNKIGLIQVASLEVLIDYYVMIERSFGLIHLLHLAPTLTSTSMYQSFFSFRATSRHYQTNVLSHPPLPTLSLILVLLCMLLFKCSLFYFFILNFPLSCSRLVRFAMSPPVALATCCSMITH